MHFLRIAAPLALLTVLSGCNSNDYSNNRYFCAGFSPSNMITSTVDAGCTSCSVSNLPAAIDGDIDSFAGIAINTAATGQGVTVRATASGAMFPIGAIPGALVGLSDAARGQLSATITTYLAGTMQETYAAQPASGVMADDGQHPSAYYGFTTVKPFDAVEFKIANGAGTAAQSVRLHGMCSNGGPLF